MIRKEIENPCAASFAILSILLPEILITFLSTLSDAKRKFTFVKPEVGKRIYFVWQSERKSELVNTQ